MTHSSKVVCAKMSLSAKLAWFFPHNHEREFTAIWLFLHLINSLFARPNTAVKNKRTLSRLISPSILRGSTHVPRGDWEREPFFIDYTFLAKESWICSTLQACLPKSLAIRQRNISGLRIMVNQTAANGKWNIKLRAVCAHFSFHFYANAEIALLTLMSN